jgi:hypothetical protein
MSVKGVEPTKPQQQLLPMVPETTNQTKVAMTQDVIADDKIGRTNQPGRKQSSSPYSKGEVCRPIG